MTARVGVILVSRDDVTLGVYALDGSGRLRAHARRAVALRDARWPAVREAVRPLAALARTRGATEVTIAVRASMRAVRGAAEEAHRWRCALWSLGVEDAPRLLFLGGVRAVWAQDGVVAELEPSGITLAHFRGRVLSATARIGLGDAPADSGLALGGQAVALVVSGSLVEEARDKPRGRAAAALKRLLKWTGNGRAVIARDAVATGLAATMLREPIPAARRASRS